MLLKKEVLSNLEKGREWAAGGGVGEVLFASRSPWPPTTTSARWTKLSPSCFFFSASYTGLKNISM